VLVQQPGDDGAIVNHQTIFDQAKERGAMISVIADLLSLTMITPPGEQGDDIAVGTTQRFGVPLFYGGPHAAYMANKERFVRQMPGRLEIGRASCRESVAIGGGGGGKQRNGEETDERRKAAA